MYSYEQAEQRREERIKEGRGTGTGADYIAWILPRDFRSRGVESCKTEGKHGREVLTLSRVEERTYFILDCNPDVVAIYDQFRLDRDITRGIAKDLGIGHRHPKCNRSGADLDMTTDFVAELRTPGGTKLVPIQCKHTTNLHDFDSAEHMEIERRYWEVRGLKLRIATESPRCIPETVFGNAKRLQHHRFLDKAVVTGDTMAFEERKALVLQAVATASTKETLNALALRLSKQTSQAITAFTHLVLHLIYRGYLVCDMRMPDLLSQDVLAVRQLSFDRVNRLGRQAP